MCDVCKTIWKRVEPLIAAREYVQIWALFDAALGAFPKHSTELFTLAYTVAQKLPNKNRYAQYQSRYFDFAIKPGDKVLDIGSGHIPFPLATHLADISTTDHMVGRAGAPFKHVDGKPVYECNVEKTPFKDKEFDFVYCSHVLEHVHNPEAACRELMRIGKRGYIECPTRGKDTFFATAKASNHLWAVECLNGELIFTEYSELEKEGIVSPILLEMACAPRTAREKAIAALEYVKAPQLNTMMVWNGHFSFSVRRQGQCPPNITLPRSFILQNNEKDVRIHEPQNVKKCFLQKLVRRLRSKFAKLIEPE